MKSEFKIGSIEKRLLQAGNPREVTGWHENGSCYYTETCGLASDDKSDLLEVALKWIDQDWFDQFDESDMHDEALELLPVTAWRALSELEAIESAEPLLGMLNELAETEDDWSLSEFPHVFARFGDTVTPLLLDYASEANNEVDARIVAVDCLVQIARYEQADGNQSTRTWVIEQLDGFMTLAEDHPIEFNSSVLTGLLDLNATESSESIERAFSENRIDICVAGDWKTVRQQLNVAGMGLPMPAEPMNGMVDFRERLGINVFYDGPLMEDGEPDFESLEDYYQAAMDSFSQSPEGREVAKLYGDIGWVWSFLEYGASYLGETVNTMSASDAPQEIVFEIFPEKSLPNPILPNQSFLN